MALNPSIILAGRGPDVAQAMQNGNALAMQAIEARDRNALSGYLQENAQGIMSGDTNALAGLAQYAPEMALNIQTQNRNNARADEQLAYQRQRNAAQDQRQAQRDARADEEWQWKVAEHARKIGAEQAAAEAQQIEDSVKVGLALSDAPAWDAYMSQNAPELVGKFDQREALAQRYMSVADIMRGGSGGNYGLTPIYGTDAEGNTVVMQIGKDGSAVQTQLPEGVTGVDLGVSARERAAGTAEGKARGEAAVGLPGVRAQAQIALDAVDDLIEDPYLPEMLGPVNSRKPNVSADAARVQSKMDKLSGEAFMQARQMLKGGGQITDYEGQRAERAMIRMNAAQNVEDYTEAMEEFKDAIRVGVMKMEAAAQRGELDIPGETADQSGGDTAKTGKVMRRKWTPDGGLQ